MAFVKVLDAARLPAGGLCEIRIESRPVALCHSSDGMYAVSGECPHAGGPLGQGALHGHRIVCPWHAWEFDCRTGECDFNTAKLDTFAVKLDGGAVWVDLDA
jgi:nitrite reductase (NADH) small subunit